MIYKSKTQRIGLEPGDTIKCRDAKEAGELADILCQKKIPFEFMYSKDGLKGIWIEILTEEAADQ